MNETWKGHGIEGALKIRVFNCLSNEASYKVILDGNAK
jgi:hypothetical protein